MSPRSGSASIGKRFHRPAVPTAALCSGLRDPIVFSHVSSDVAMPAPTLPPPVEDAFAVHVHHAGLSSGDAWIAGRHRPLERVREGSVFIWDLRTEPVAQIHEGFEFSRFHIPRTSFDDLAYEQGIRRPCELRAATCEPDSVLQHLALATIHRVTLLGQDRDTLFMDSVGLALFSHMAQSYAGQRAPAIPCGVLSPRQMRQVNDWVDAHLGEAVSVADLAGLVRLSRSYFSRAFRKTTGMSPHRWLLQRRIDLAKRLLVDDGRPLCEVAVRCGFVDQSHFTNVFARIVRTTPGKWRQQGR